MDGSDTQERHNHSSDASTNNNTPSSPPPTPTTTNCATATMNVVIRESIVEPVVDATKSVAKTTTKATKSVAKSTKRAVNLVLPTSTEDEAERRWKELQRLEKKRRAILKRTEEPFWKTLLYWDGTVLQHLQTDSVLWLTMALYVATRILAREGLPDFVSDLDSGRMGIVGGFLTFFIVFYVNQSHKRFFQLYGHSMACKGRIFDAATLAKSCHMPDAQAMRMIRYMNAAHAAAYIGLSSVYPAHCYFDRVCLQDFQMLTQEEMERMDDINMDAGGSAYRELIVWAMLQVQNAKDSNLIDRELAAMLRDQILQLRAQAGQLYNAADLPIPFFYVHFICLLTAMYLPLFAITQGISAGTGDDVSWVIDVVAGLVVFLQSIFIIGLRIVGQKVSDPYGDDLVDLSVMFFIQFTWTQSNRVMAARDPPKSTLSSDGGTTIGGREVSTNLNDTSEEIENVLARNRITIGKAWDDGTDRGLGGTAVGKRRGSEWQGQNAVVGVDAESVDNSNDGDPEASGRTEENDDDSASDDISDHSAMHDQIGFGGHSVK